MRATACLGLAVLLLQTETVHAAPVPPLSQSIAVPDFALQVLASHNNQGLPFLVIDKVQARVWVFNAQGALVGTSAALLGVAIGDSSAPDIGERALAGIRPEERITPAGRFASTLGRNLQGEEVLWVDYDSGLSLHRVIHGQAAERRAQRLASPTPADNRVSYGCINVPSAFFNALVLATARKNGGIVYILPETRALEQVFDFLPPRSVR
jgi:hypothetical protein